MTTRDEIKIWLQRAQEAGATHMIVVCDTYDYDDYPVHILPGQDVHHEIEKRNGKNMQKIMEVYSLSLDIEMQLNEHRAWHTE